MKDNQILFDNGGYIIESDSGGLLIGQKCFSPKGDFVDLNADKAQFVSGDSVFIGEQSLKGYIQDLIDAAGVKNHTHDFSFRHQHEYYDSGDKLNTFGASPSSGTTGGPK